MAHPRIKKQFGQHFLRWPQITQAMCERVNLTSTSSVLEIGPGDGFLTKTILQYDIARLWAFEIDADWVEYLNKTIDDNRLTVFHENILDVDVTKFEPHTPWTVLANLPYLITFPILHLLQKNRALLKEGVVMMQEEVAQKIVKTGGRGYGYPSLFFQYYFDWELMQKIPPQAFEPPPKVFSRLLYFKPKQSIVPIPQEKQFWKFIRLCFSHPRRTLRNNLKTTHFDLNKISDETLALRAQQMKMADFISIWDNIR